MAAMPLGPVAGGPHHGKMEPVLAADIAEEYLADMEPEIHVRGRQALGGAAEVQLLDARGGGGGGGNRGAARRRAVLGPEDREHAIADQLQDVATAVMNRRDHRIGIV